MSSPFFVVPFAKVCRFHAANPVLLFLRHVNKHYLISPTLTRLPPFTYFVTPSLLVECYVTAILEVEIEVQVAVVRLGNGQFL